MTDTMKKILLAGLALLTVLACDRFATQTYEDDVAVPLAEGQSDSLLFSVSLEYVKGGMLIPAMEKINRALVQQAFDLEGSEMGLEESAAAYRENLIDEYLNESGSWEDKINGVFTTRWKGWRNYLLSYYNFRGGAHGIQTVVQLVFDAKTGDLLTEQALFAEGYVAPVAALMRQAVQADMEAESPELLDLVELESIAPNGNFSVNEAGVQWLFQPYEAGPFALGIVSAFVPWDRLKPYLK